MSEAKFSVGQIIRHNKFDYRGVVFDVDAVFSLSDEWYEQVARSRPPKDRPWYHVLVDRSHVQTYVAERHLEPDDSGEPIEHPLVDTFFARLEGGAYVPLAGRN